MKEKVNTIRRERVIYDSVFKKLELDLKVKEEEVQRHIGEAIEIEEERKLIFEELKEIRGAQE
jgi:hypothetical protein